MSISNILNDFSGNEAESWTNLKVKTIDAENISLKGFSPDANQFLRSNEEKQAYWGSIELDNLPVSDVDNTFLKTQGGEVIWAPAEAVANVDPEAINGGVLNQILSFRGGVTQWVNQLVLNNIPAGLNNTYLTTVGGVIGWRDYVQANININQINPGGINQILATNSVGATQWINKIQSNQVDTAGADLGFVYKVGAGNIASWQANNITLSNITPGAENQVIVVSGGNAVWRNQINLSNIPTGTNGNILKTQGGSTQWVNQIMLNNIPAGTNSQVLKTSGANVIWDFISPSNFTPGEEGQVLRTIANTPTWTSNISLSNIPAGTNGYVLSTIAGTPTWTDPTIATISPNAIEPGVDGQFLSTISDLTQWTDKFQYSNFPPGTNGQIIKNTAGNWNNSDTINLSNIPVGTNGQVLSTVGGVTQWANTGSLLIPISSINPGTENYISRVVGGISTWQEKIDLSNLPNGVNANPQAMLWNGTNWVVSKFGPAYIIPGGTGTVLTTNGSGVVSFANRIALINLPIGTNGQVMSTTGGVAAWESTIGLANIPVGTNGQVLTTNAGAVSWNNPVVTPGTNGQILRTVSGVSQWSNTIGLTNIPAGTNGQVLTTSSGSVSWQPIPPIFNNPAYFQAKVTAVYNLNNISSTDFIFGSYNTPNPTYLEFDGTFLKNVSGQTLVIKVDFVVNTSTSNSAVDIYCISDVGFEYGRVTSMNTGLSLNTNMITTLSFTNILENTRSLKAVSIRNAGTGAGTNAINTIENQCIFNLSVLGTQS